MTRIYGIKSCDTCRKALKILVNAGIEAQLHDLRENPLSHDEYARFFDLFGEKLINSRSTTWRGMSGAERARAPVDLLVDYPALMKRPVVETGDVITLGWSDDTAARHIAAA